MEFDIPITRLELIDHTKKGEGREFVRYYDKPVKIEVDVQDDNRTLKVFVTDRPAHLKGNTNG